MSSRSISRAQLMAGVRARLLSLCAIVSSMAALIALLDPDRVARATGEFLIGVNGYSQFYASYVGVRLATATLAYMAAGRRDQPVLGDLTAMFLLAPPVGRLIAAFAIGLPKGFLFAVCAVELLAGLTLLALRPRAKSVPSP